MGISSAAGIRNGILRWDKYVCVRRKVGSMILVTKLNGAPFALNPDLIETIAENPDTTIKLTNGTTYIVNEKMNTVLDLILQYRRRVFRNIINVTESQTKPE